VLPIRASSCADRSKGAYYAPWLLISGTMKIGSTAA
jgi:hypothetical protein